MPGEACLFVRDAGTVRDGGRLRPIAVREGAGTIYWLPDEQSRAPAQG